MFIINPYRYAAGGGGGVWTAVATATASADSGAWNGVTLRETVKASSLTDLTGTQIRITMGAGSGEALTITKARFGPESGADGSCEFGSSPTIITWDSGSTSKTISAGAEAVSDPITYSYTGLVNLLFAFYTNGGTSADTYRSGAGTGFTNVQSRWKTADEVDTVGSLSGYSSIAGNFIRKIEALV